MSSYLHMKSFLAQEKIIELLGGWSPLPCKDKVKKINNWLKNQILSSKDQKKEMEINPYLDKELPAASKNIQTSSRTVQIQAQRTSEKPERCQYQSRQVQLAQTLPTSVQESQI
ncbi:hypothetical protein O181_050534 [Austropuccinia psidii MF-1]|uniref:Uncharacterized protein n=1 Tax=Austropuccinia psidii MF-1 TaxID=1389203 RepID=A0A9Q3HPS8_9BASI|nr:hypothetical protein [Austropuccinia psidii MF-1]